MRYHSLFLSFACYGLVQASTPSADSSTTMDTLQKLPALDKQKKMTSSGSIWTAQGQCQMTAERNFVGCMSS